MGMLGKGREGEDLIGALVLDGMTWFLTCVKGV